MSMSDFLHGEAEEAGSSEDVEDSDSEAEIQPKRSKKSKKKKAKKVVDSDDDEEDDEAMDQNLEGFIDDNPDVEDEEGGSGEESGDDRGKRKHDEDSELDEDIEDDEYDLLEENLGIKLQRKKKHKRIRVMSDEESDKEGAAEDDRAAIAREIFDDDDAGSERDDQEPVAKPQELQAQVYADLSDSGEESDNFIVDDEGQPVTTHKKKRHVIHDDAALQEAQDIFGVDFDFEDFDQFGDEYDEAEEDEDEDEYEDDDDETPKPRKASNKKVRKRGKKTTIFEIFEPSELERSHFTDQDQEIRAADMPERFQLRQVPICPTEEGEQELEAEWIYKQAFCTLPISRQDYWEQEDAQGSTQSSKTKPPTAVDKIKSALNFMRNQQFEVPFIAFYRKEYVEPELNINDLWKVYHWDEKWMQLRSRKSNLVRLFEKMQKYQFDSIDPDKPLESHIRALVEEDIERVRGVQTMEELRDVYNHFLLYYGRDIPKMKNFMKKKKKKEKEDKGETEEEVKKEEEEDDEDADALKQASRKTGYSICVQAGLADMARKFGLEAEKIAENFRDNYTRHECDQDPAEPQELALEFVNNQFKTADDVLKGARHMVAMQIAHEPLVKSVVRNVFYERVMISIASTKKGMKEIDEVHPCYSIKYIKNKPVSDLHNDLFMHIQQSADDGNLTYEIHMDEKPLRQKDIDPHTYFKEIVQLYHRDEFSNLVQEWNKQRSEALERALTMILYPQLIKEVKTKLLEEAKEHVLKGCCRKLYSHLKVAPYAPDQQVFDEDDDFDTSGGVRVLGLAFGETLEDASFASLIDGEGEVVDFLRLPHITVSRDSWRPQDKALKERDMEKFKDFIQTKKPHVIAVAAASKSTFYYMDDLKQVVSELEQEQQMPPVPIELVDNEMSVTFANSKKAHNEFREYPTLLCVAISIARRIQEPLVEFAQMCNSDEDILCLKYHPFQDVLAKEKLLSALYLEFVNRINEVGVDVNRCVAHAHMAPLVQFVCGLGPRKGYHLLKILKQNNSRLENRTQLVTMCHMGPKVFINCAGFIKIDTSALGDSTEAYVEVLDGSRVHPETYEWARKMAIDALEYDETADDANPAGALEEILENPDKLRELDLDAFAEELDRQGYGNKHITLYDIRAELNHRYKDLRVPYRTPTDEERFNMLTKETPQTFHPGKLVLCRVQGIAHRRPMGEQLDQANPVRNDETGLWQCPFCQKSDFPELSEVWNHFDAQQCVGQPIGVKVRLDNEVNGFIHLSNLSDKHVKDPSARVRHGMMLHARIVKIDIQRFSVNLTSKSSDLLDEDSKWKPVKDAYYEFEADERDKKKEEDKKKQKARQTYVKRVIVHPQFFNVDYKGCTKVMETMDQGDCVIRPSSKGTDHLTCTWKVCDDILQHVDVREESKENAFSLGRSLWIANEEYEDLDEIIARFVQPIAGFARDITGYKYYRDISAGQRELQEKMLYDEKRKAPSKIPYFLSASKDFPGKFLLSYLPRKTARHEYVTVTPEGVRYRQQMFHSLSALVRWFKEHFRDPIPGGTPASMSRTPAGGGSTVSHTPGQTPSMRSRTDPGSVKGTPGIASSMFGQMRVPGQTPTMGYHGMRQTPMMTPVLTPQIQHQHMTTPSQPFTTPANPYATPANPLSTPQYQATPRSQQWPQRTPSDRTPPSSAQSAASRASASASAQDWAKMAEMWAKRKDSGGTPSGRSPRGPRISPRGPGISPRGSGVSPRGPGRSPYGGGHTPGTPRHTPGTPRHTPGTPRHTPGTPRHTPGTPRHLRTPGTPRSRIGTPGTPRDGGSTPLYDEF